MQPHMRRLALGLLVAVGITGCIIVPDRRPYVGGVVMAAPPLPREEVIGVAPAPGYIWLNGYWNWVGGRHVWVPGYWAAPRPGLHWVAPLWVRRGNGWLMRPGHWVRGY